MAVTLGGSLGITYPDASTTAPTGFINSLKFTTTTADTDLGTSQSVIVQQRIEGTNVADLAWGTASASPVTLSFWVRSSLTGTLNNARTTATSANGANTIVSRDASGNFSANIITGTNSVTAPAVAVSNGIFVNTIAIAANYTIPTNYNAGSFGPVTVNSGITVTVPSGSVWTIV
jgi:hypothetical protein